MQKRVASNGGNQVLLEPLEPQDLASLAPGALVDVTVRLAPSATSDPQKLKRAGKGWIIRDPRTGLPALTLGEGAPKITHEDVATLLVNFP